MLGIKWPMWESLAPICPRLRLKVVGWESSEESHPGPHREQGLQHLPFPQAQAPHMFWAFPPKAQPLIPDPGPLG